MTQPKAIEVQSVSKHFGAYQALKSVSFHIGSNEFFTMLPTKLDAIGTIGSYGSWLNFYVCQIGGVIPNPEGYYGDVGVQSNSARCAA